MKTKNLLISCLLTVLCFAQAASAKQIEVMKGNFGIDEDMYFPTEITFDYNDKDQLIKVTLSYIIDEDLAEKITDEWGTSILPGEYPVYYYQYEYNDNGQISIFEAWDGIDSFGEEDLEYDLYSKYSYTYNNKGLVESRIEYGEDEHDPGQFIPYEKLVYTYDEYGNTLNTEEYDYDDDGNEILDKKKITTVDGKNWTITEQFYDEDGEPDGGPDHEYWKVTLNDDGLIGEIVVYSDETRNTQIIKIELSYENGKVSESKYYSYIDNDFVLAWERTMYHPAYGLPELLHDEFMGDDPDYNFLETKYNPDDNSVNMKDGIELDYDDFVDAYPRKVKAVYVEEETGEEPLSVTMAEFDIVYRVFPPTAPAGFQSTVQTTNSVTLSWETQPNLSGYILEYKKSLETTWAAWTSAPDVDATEATITGLADNTLYDFRLTAFNEKGSKASTTSATTKELTSIPENGYGEISVYPNPVERGQTINIELPSGKLAGAQLEMLNSSGALLLQQPVTTQRTEVKMPATSGVYLIRIYSEGYDETVKVVVK